MKTRLIINYKVGNKQYVTFYILSIELFNICLKCIYQNSPFIYQLYDVGSVNKFSVKKNTKGLLLDLYFLYQNEYFNSIFKGLKSAKILQIDIIRVK